MVVEGERERRPRDRRRRPRRQRLDAPAEPVAEPPDPAAADEYILLAGHLGLRRRAQQRERVIAGCRHPCGRRPEQRRVAEQPFADQRKRPLVLAQPPDRPGRIEVAVQRHPVRPHNENLSLREALLERADLVDSDELQELVESHQ